MYKPVQIGTKTIFDDNPCYIIAEAGVNHNGSLETALELVRKAKEIGADCVKFQTFKASSVITTNAPKADYQLKVTDNNESQLEMLQKLELSKDDYLAIIKLCKELDIQFLSTPYNKDDADFLNELGVDAFKIASGQLVELSFLEYVAKLGKPIILSTGMATLAEAYEAVEAVRGAGNNDVIVLQCTTNYPSSIDDANIRSMISIKEALDVLVGYSDHVPNNFAAFAAVALNACVIEKHFTLDKEMPGPDHSSSLNPDEFQEFIQSSRLIERALGSKVKRPTAAELKNITGMRRSIVATSSIPANTVLEEHMFEFKRPATGLEPKLLKDVVGKKARVDIEPDLPLTYNMIEW